MEERDIYLDDIEVIKNSDGTYTACDKYTGEILDKNDSRLDIAIENQKKVDSLNKAKKKGISKVQGKVDINETHHTDWKAKNYFIKIYRTEMREYKKRTKLSTNASIILFYLQDYIEFGTNKISKEKDIGFSNSDISELTGISIRSVGGALKELEDKAFIIRKGSTHNREIYMNPFLICAGNVIDKGIVEQFKKIYTPLTPY